MGSQSDWETMRHAAEMLEPLGVPHEARIVSAHRTPERLYRLCRGRARPRAQGHHRRRRRRGASAGHGGGDDAAAGARRAGREPGAEGHGQPALDRPDAGAASRSARWPSARPARPMPALLAAAILALADAGAGRAGWMPGARRRPPAWPKRPRATPDMSLTGDPLPPGATIGILGGGQLGRMSALAAARLGYRCHVFAPEADSPGMQVAAAATVAAYEDADGACRASPPRSTSSPSNSRTSRPRRLATLAAAGALPAGRRGAADLPGPAGGKGLPEPRRRAGGALARGA